MTNFSFATHRNTFRLLIHTESRILLFTISVLQDDGNVTSTTSTSSFWGAIAFQTWTPTSVEIVYPSANKNIESGPVFTDQRSESHGNIHSIQSCIEARTSRSSSLIFGRRLLPSSLHPFFSLLERLPFPSWNGGTAHTVISYLRIRTSPPTFIIQYRY